MYEYMSTEHSNNITDITFTTKLLQGQQSNLNFVLKQKNHV